MDIQLHLLETFSARGSDGKLYAVRGYERMARVDGVPGLHGQWEPTGVAELRLDDGRHVGQSRDGALSVGEVRLERLGAH